MQRYAQALGGRCTYVADCGVAATPRYVADCGVAVTPCYVMDCGVAATPRYVRDCGVNRAAPQRALLYLDYK